MRINIKDMLENVIKILMVLVIVLIIIGAVNVGKKFFSNIQSNVETVPNYDEHEPQY